MYIYVYANLSLLCLDYLKLWNWMPVYEGTKSFYKEEDETVPVNLYGKSKVAAEQFITAHCSNFAILRSSIIFGPQTISPVPKSLPIQVLFCVMHYLIWFNNFQYLNSLTDIREFIYMPLTPCFYR